MTGRVTRAGGLLALTLVLAAGTTWARPPQDNEKDKEALAKNAEAFIEAFGKGDAKALAAFWVPTGSYTDQGGRVQKGREAIEKAFASVFEESKGLQLRIDSDTLRFVTPEVALEDGTTAVIAADGAPPTQTRYTILHVKKDGTWMLDSVREARFDPPSNFEHLRRLEWLVGEWADEPAKGDATRATFAWSENQNFLISTFTIGFQNVTVASGTQWIGWDPIAKNVRSWTFDGDGGFGEGTWAWAGNKYIMKNNLVLRDGKKVASTSVLTRVDANTITWDSTERKLDGKPLPDAPSVTLKRSK